MDQTKKRRSRGSSLKLRRSRLGIVSMTPSEFAKIGVIVPDIGPTEQSIESGEVALRLTRQPSAKAYSEWSVHEHFAARGTQSSTPIIGSGQLAR